MSGKMLRKLPARGRRRKRALKPQSNSMDEVYRLCDEVSEFGPGDRFWLNGVWYEIPGGQAL